MLRSAGLLRISPRAGVRGSLCSHHVFVIVLLRTEIRENCSHSAGQSLASKPLRVSNKDQIISLRRNGKKQWQAVNREEKQRCHFQAIQETEHISLRQLVARRGGRREGAGSVCGCRDRKKQRRTERESAKTYRTHFIKKSFFLLLNFNTIYFSFLFDVQCSHTLLECHKIVFKWTTNPCSCNRKTLTHAGRLSSSSISTVKSSQTALGIIPC